ncbi:hypothetical protein PINS_up009302 [Pythium insidiosum]|nr:hypothetical protein PINS_up009302 [Pythium insidiosum]
MQAAAHVALPGLATWPSGFDHVARPRQEDTAELGAEQATESRVAEAEGDALDASDGDVATERPAAPVVRDGGIGIDQLLNSSHASVDGEENDVVERAQPPPAPATQNDDPNTDDEDLHYLPRLFHLHGGISFLSRRDVAGQSPGEATYEDVLRVIFQSARDQKEDQVLEVLRITRELRSIDGEDVIRGLVRAEDDTGLSLLMICVRHGLMAACKALVDAGADVNQTNDKRPYALLLAAQKGHTDMTAFLLEHDANEESKNMALIPAAHFGHIDVVNLLLNAGADQNYSNKKGTTPLMRAAQEGRDEVVGFLIGRGADACAANNEGMTALMLAAQRGHAAIATVLIKAGSDVNTQTRQGSTALLLAAKRGHSEAVEALLAAGADIYMKDDRHKTAAETAHRRGHVELYLKITVANQLRLMREGLRHERYAMLMRISCLFVASRADFAPSMHLEHRRSYRDLMDRALKLPRPLLQNVALFLPLCPLWERQLQYLMYEIPTQPSRVVHHGVRIMDEILLSVALELLPTLHDIRQSAHTGSGQLTLLRDNRFFSQLFTHRCTPPLPQEVATRLRRMADIRGVLTTYTAGPAIQFGMEVAQDVVTLLTDLLRWDATRRHAELHTCSLTLP